MTGRRLDRTTVEVEPEVLMLALARACAEHGVALAAAPILAAQCHRETGLRLECYSFGYVKAHADWDGDFFYRYATELLSPHEAQAALAQAAPRTDGAGSNVMARESSQGVWFVQAWPDHPLARFRGYASLAEGASGWLDKLTSSRYRAALRKAEAGEAVGYVEAVRAAGYFTEPLSSYLRGYDEAVPRMRAVYDRTVGAPYATALADVHVRAYDGPPLADWGKHWVQGGIFGWRRNAAGTRWQGFEPAHQTYDQHDYGTTTIGAWDCPRYACAEVPSGAWLSLLPLWDARTDAPARLGALEAAAWLEEHGGRLPTVDELRELEAMSPFLEPVTLPDERLPGERPGSPRMGTLAWCLLHDATVRRRARSVGYYDDPAAPRAASSSTVEPAAGSPSTPTLRRGSQGPSVERLQRVIGATADGVFGSGTERRLRVWQASQGLAVDGVAGPATWRAVAAHEARADAGPSPDIAVLDGLPYRAAALQFEVPPGGLTQIMIHTAEVDPVEGAARRLALDASVLDRASWHYSVDGGEVDEGAIWCSVLPDRAAGGARGARHAVHLELATRIATQRGGRWVPSPPDWEDRYHRQMLARARGLVEALSALLDVPLRRLSLEEVLGGERGVLGHGDHTAACHEAQRRGMRVAPWWSSTRGWAGGTHTDPGPSFPWEALGL